MGSVTVPGWKPVNVGLAVDVDVDGEVRDAVDHGDRAVPAAGLRGCGAGDGDRHRRGGEEGVELAHRGSPWVRRGCRTVYGVLRWLDEDKR
jgi:hypothetical protein